MNDFNDLKNIIPAQPETVVRFPQSCMTMPTIFRDIRSRMNAEYVRLFYGLQCVRASRFPRKIVSE